MKFLQLCLVILMFIFAGCTTTNVNRAPVISTYNTSSNANTAKQKSTKTYPGSSPQIKTQSTIAAQPNTEQYAINNAYESKMPPKGVVTTPADELAPSTPLIAMATPTPSTSV